MSQAKEISIATMIGVCITSLNELNNDDMHPDAREALNEVVDLLEICKKKTIETADKIESAVNKLSEEPPMSRHIDIDLPGIFSFDRKTTDIDAPGLIGLFGEHYTSLVDQDGDEHLYSVSSLTDIIDEHGENMEERQKKYVAYMKEQMDKYEDACYFRFID